MHHVRVAAEPAQGQQGGGALADPLHRGGPRVPEVLGEPPLALQVRDADRMPARHLATDLGQQMHLGAADVESGDDVLDPHRTSS